MYYVGFSTAVLIASLILFQGLNTTDGITTISLLMGFVITFLGVHLLNISREPEPPRHHGAYEAVLEHGIMNPRMSISGRLSLDGWNGAGNGMMNGGYRADGAPFSAGHGRRSSLYRHQSSTLYSAFGEDEEEAAAAGGSSAPNGQGQETMGLRRLREEPEPEDPSEDEMSDADERTKLRSGGGRSGESARSGASGRKLQNGKQNGVARSGSRSHSGSPMRSPR